MIVLIRGSDMQASGRNAGNYDEKITEGQTVSCIQRITEIYSVRLHACHTRCFDNFFRPLSYTAQSQSAGEVKGGDRHCPFFI